MVEGIIRNFCVKSFRNWAIGSEVVVFLCIFSSDGYFVQLSRIVWCNFGKGHYGNICVKLSLKLVSPKILNSNKNQHDTNTS